MLIFIGIYYCFRDRDPSLCAECITEVIVSDMEAYIPHSFSWPKSFKPWFNTACSHAIHDREVAHKRYLSLLSPESHALLYFCPKSCQVCFSTFQKIPSFTECQNLSRYNSPQDFSHLGKNISNNFTS